MPSNKKNSSWLALQYSITLVLSFVNLKLNLHTFGGELFAVWLLLLSVWNLSGTLDLGFTVSIVKFVSMHKADNNKLSKILGTALFFFALFGMSIFLIAYILGHHAYINNRNLVSINNLSIARITFIILGIQFYINYICNFFRSVLEGLSQFITMAKINIVVNLIQHTAIIIIFIYKLSIFHLALAVLLTSTINLLLSFFYYSKKLPALQIHRLSISRQAFKEIFRFSFSVQITYLLGSLIDPITKYILGNFYSKEYITIFEIAKRFSLAVIGIFHAAFKYVFTNASALSGQKNYVTFIQRECVKVSKFGQFFAVFTFGIFAPFFLLIFDKFYNYPESIIVFMILTLAESINCIGFSIYVFITGIGGVNYLAILQLSNVILNSLLLFLGIKLFDNPYGLIGYFISVIIGNYLMMLYIRNKTGIKILSFYKDINIKKSILFSLAILINIIALHYHFYSYYHIQLFFSLIFIILFYKEIFHYSNYFINMGENWIKNYVK